MLTGTVLLQQYSFILNISRRVESSVIDSSFNFVILWGRNVADAIDKQTVADLVGHCDTSFLERTYCHPRLDKKRSAAEAFAAVQFGESIRSRP